MTLKKAPRRIAGDDTMDLLQLVGRATPTLPWVEGDNIPWNEPGFSRRMLKEHLSQEHDAASRRFETIDRQVGCIHTKLLASQPSRILDLGCGPGLYSERLARLGHTCHGIDYSPASIEYAAGTARRDHLACTFTCQDIRQAEFPPGNRLVMLIYGEFNVFRPADARLILEKAWESLNPGGWLLLEPHPYHVIQHLGTMPAYWYSSMGGLFSDQPYLVLHENHWHADLHAITIRYYVIDAHSAQVQRYAQSMQAYTDEEYLALLESCGFEDMQIIPAWLAKDTQNDLMVITARKKAGVAYHLRHPRNK